MLVQLTLKLTRTLGGFSYLICYISKDQPRVQPIAVSLLEYAKSDARDATNLHDV